MRITGGILGSRRLRVPDRGVRPTQDRVRAALFSSLAERVAGARVLDLFSGSGALGLEAWSRGAAAVTWVEQARPIFGTLRQNVDTLCAGGGGETRCVHADVFSFLRREPPGHGYDLIFADPPYAPGGEGSVLRKTLRCIMQRSILAANGLFVFESGTEEPTVVAVGWHLLDTKTYGQSKLLYYAHATPREGAEPE